MNWQAFLKGENDMATPIQPEIHTFDDPIHSPGTEENFGYAFSSQPSLPHTHHGFAEFSLFIYGKWDNIYNNKRYALDKNALIFLGDESSHELKLRSPSGNHFTFFFRKEYFDWFCETYFPEQRELKNVNYRQIFLDQSVATFLLTEAEKMISSRVGTGHIVQLRNFLHNLILFVSETIKPQTTTKFTHGSHLQIRLDRFECLNISINDLCSEFPISKGTLIKEFKAVTGKTIVEYRNEKRMEYAAQLLQKWNCTIAEVATAVGISSLSHFSKQFKQQYGILPKEYRNYHCW